MTDVLPLEVWMQSIIKLNINKAKIQHVALFSTARPVACIDAMLASDTNNMRMSKNITFYAISRNLSCTIMRNNFCTIILYH